MTPAEAEIEICKLAQSYMTVDENSEIEASEKADILNRINEEIAEFKKITGPRTISGEVRMGGG